MLSQLLTFLGLLGLGPSLYCLQEAAHPLIVVAKVLRKNSGSVNVE